MEITRDKIQHLDITSKGDIGEGRRKGISLAKDIGFSEIGIGQIAIIVTELLTNVIKHGGGKGNLMMCRLKEGDNTGIELWCCDFGKGISNQEMAINDGYTEKDSLGVGLGAINRMSDEMILNPDKQEIKIEFPELADKQYNYCVRTRKWINNTSWQGKNKKLEMGAVSIPKPGEKFNGDTYVYASLDHNKTIAAVIDGLGHGKHANIASSMAKETILKYLDLEPGLLIKKVHEDIKGTRGITLGLIKIDTEKNKLWFTGIGNIEGNIVSGNDKKNLLSYGGIVGHTMRTPRIFEFDFKKGDSVYMFSDGITTRWSYDDINWVKMPQENAEYIYNKYNRLNDDATILIIRYSA